MCFRRGFKRRRVEFARIKALFLVTAKSFRQIRFQFAVIYQRLLRSFTRAPVHAKGVGRSEAHSQNLLAVEGLTQFESNDGGKVIFIPHDGPHVIAIGLEHRRARRHWDTTEEASRR